MAEPTESFDEESRRLLAEIEAPPTSDAPPAAHEEPAPPEAQEPPPAARPGWGRRAAARRRGIAGGVMAVAGAAWLGVGAATWMTLPCALGGVFLAAGLWVVLGPKS